MDSEGSEGPVANFRIDKVSDKVSDKGKPEGAKKWPISSVLHEVKTAAKAADHFRWPPALVRCAMAFAKAFRGDIEQQRLAEAGA